MKPKLAIIVPYRDREEHLAQFVPHMEKFLSDKEIDFKIPGTLGVIQDFSVWKYSRKQYLRNFI